MDKTDAEKLLSNANAILESEGTLTGDNNSMTAIEKFEKLILPAFENSKNIQSSLYSYQPTPGKGFVRKVKNTVLSKVRNITIAVLERTIMRQQKVNELTYQALKEVVAELKQLSEKQSEK